MLQNIFWIFHNQINNYSFAKQFKNKIMTLLILAFVSVLTAVAICRQGSRIQSNNDEIRRREYQHRQDTKGGTE